MCQMLGQLDSKKCTRKNLVELEAVEKTQISKSESEHAATDIMSSNRFHGLWFSGSLVRSKERYEKTINGIVETMNVGV